ncbi:monocarboxylate permease-like protein [Moniliophthora roreri MCA 2997]|uniref:Monocarboxylate permease-like protein n=1 Tax=Moniliophthora roreri (strain MCA 2997) TaxID=1381753 RepID=V2XBQ3_MONRO|nr:monocarboxylate permease-like protein [Moniliophthora roreri MCA 2997]
MASDSADFRHDGEDISEQAQFSGSSSSEHLPLDATTSISLAASSKSKEKKSSQTQAVQVEAFEVVDPEKDQRPVEASSPPPDGGLRAWLVVLGSSLVSLATFGIVNAYGAFSDEYQHTRLSNYSPTLVSMIGSIQVFLLYFLGAFSGSIFDAVGPRYMIPASGLICSFAMFMLSITKPQQIYQVYLTQSILFNIGGAFGFFPSVSVIAQWFKFRLAYAMGFVIASAGLGGIIFPSMIRQLVPKIGFGWTVRIIAFIVLFCFTVATLTIRSRRPTKPLPPFKSILAFTAWRDRRFVVFAIGAFFNIFSMFPVFFSIGAYGIATDNTEGAYLLIILSATTIVGRVLPNFLADKIGRFNTIAFSTTVAAIFSLSLWFTADGKEGNTIAFAAVYGFFSGPLFSLMPPCIAYITPVDRVGGRIGMLFAFLSFAGLAGSPLGGLFLNGGETVPHFKNLILYTGCVGLFGSAMLIAARFTINRKLWAAV